MVIETRILIITIIGFALLGMSWLPRVLRQRPLTLPILYVLFGMVIFSLPLNLGHPDPIQYSRATEYLTEFIVIVSLTGTGLTLDRKFDLLGWRGVWALLLFTLPMTVLIVALLGWQFMDLTASAAILLGAVLAPTDPMFASDVQAGPPRTGEEDEVRFALSLEAGLNDGLAFPFVFLAIAVIGKPTVGEVLGQWFLADLILKIAIAVIAGIGIGRFLAFFIFRVSAETHLARTSEGLIALAITFITYGLTQMMNGYGFLAVFIAALTLRHYNRDHPYIERIYNFALQLQRIMVAGALILFGGGLVHGILLGLTWEAVSLSVFLVLLIRPITAWIALAGSRISPDERIAISFLGIRGLGGLYYLAYALNSGAFIEARLLWATAGFTVLLSLLVHGVSAQTMMRYLDNKRHIPLEQTNAEIELDELKEHQSPPE